MKLSNESYFSLNFIARKRANKEGELPITLRITMNWKTQARMTPAAKVDLTPENNLILPPLNSLADGVSFILVYLPLKALSLRTLSPVSVIR